MPNPVVHFEIGTANTEESAAFYRDLFGWEIHSADPGYALVDAAGGGIGGVEDLAASLEQAVKLGGKALVQPTPIEGFGSFALFLDLDDNIIGLLQSQ
jgi:uncharacterized protein